MTDNLLPTPDDLLESPELAILATLDVALISAAHALFAAHPQLMAGELPDEPTAQTCIADAIIAHATLLRRCVDTYRRLAGPSPHDDRATDDADF